MQQDYNAAPRGIEIHVPESDTHDLRILDRSDLGFAFLYGLLFLWGLVFTLLAIT